MSVRSVAAITLALVILVDGNYPGHVAFTESLYLWLCAPLLGFTLLELIAYGMLGVALMHAQNSRAIVYQGQTYKILLRVALAPLLASIWSTMIGLLLHQGRLQIAVWQTRGLPMVWAWSIVAFYFCRSPRDILKILNVISVAVFFKAIHSLIVLFTVHGGTLEEEWLTSHEASLFMGVVLLYLGTRVFTWPGIGQKIALLVPIVVIACHWVVNDRRVSFLGVGFSFIFAIAFLYQVTRMWHVAAAVLISAAAILQQVATWNSPNNWLRGIVEPETDSSSDYREVENFDLYYQVARHPILGVGYGNPFETPIELPNIVQIASLLAWVPHNSLLMVWSMGGPISLAAIGVFITFSIAVFVRIFRTSRDLQIRTIAFVGFGAIVQWTLYAWADMGLSSPAMVLVPAVLGGAGFKLLHLKGVA